MVKATVKKPTAPPADVDLDNPESVDAFARDIGVESTTSAGTGEGSETLTGEAPKTLALAAPADAAPAARAPANLAFAGGEDSGFEGEFDMSDIKVPRLTIVNGSGELATKFNQGSLLFSDMLLWNPPNPQTPGKSPAMLFVPVKIKKQFRENLTKEESEEGLLPRIASTRQEAEEMGGTTQWINNQKPRWSPSAMCLLLLQEPDHQDLPEGERHPAFAYVLDDKNWALGVYYVGGTAYNEFVKPITENGFTTLKEAGKTVIEKRIWNFQITKKKAGNFTVFVPLIRLLRTDTAAEARSFIRAFRGGGNNAQVAAE